jgi:hypothetical protein
MNMIEQMKAISDFVKALEHLKDFTIEEKDTFITDLVGAIIFKGRSELLDKLLNKDLKNFKEHVQFMIETGKELKGVGHE